MRAENAQLHVQIKDRRTGTELFVRQQQRIMRHSPAWMSSELLEGPGFWLADMRIKDLPQTCIDLAIEVFADYYNADLRMIFADALEDAGDPLCDSQRRVADIIRAVNDQREDLDGRLCIGGALHGKIVPAPMRLYTPFSCTLAGSEFTVKAIRELDKRQVVEMARQVIRERFEKAGPMLGSFHT